MPLGTKVGLCPGHIVLHGDPAPPKKAAALYAFAVYKATSFHISVCYRSNETRAPIANPPNSAQPEVTPTIPPSYIRVRAVVWECGKGQTDRHRQRQCTFHLGYASREM